MKPTLKLTDRHRKTWQASALLGAIQATLQVVAGLVVILLVILSVGFIVGLSIIASS